MQKSKPLGVKENKQRPGRPETRLLWTVERACAEFRINPRTLASRLKQLGIMPLKGGYYTTLQIASGVYGDLESERIRETKESADKLALHNAKERRELVETDSVLRVFGGLATHIRHVVKHSSLSDIEKHALLKQIRAVTIEDLIDAKDAPGGES